jgi:hypothetical protein
MGSSANVFRMSISSVPWTRPLGLSGINFFPMATMRNIRLFYSRQSRQARLLLAKRADVFLEGHEKWSALYEMISLEEPNKAGQVEGRVNYSKRKATIGPMRVARRAGK